MSGTAFQLAAFGRPITAERLGQLIPSPLPRVTEGDQP